MATTKQNQVASSNNPPQRIPDPVINIGDYTVFGHASVENHPGYTPPLQELMETCFSKSPPARFAVMYLDDVIILSDSFEEHMTHVYQVFGLSDYLGSAVIRMRDERLDDGLWGFHVMVCSRPSWVDDNYGVRQGDKETRRQGDKETRRQGDKETRRQGDKETRRQGDKETRRQGGKGTCQVPGVLFSVLLFFSILLPRNGKDGKGTEKHTVAALCGTMRGVTLVLYL
ncbi:hypothetical protein V496_00904 [Pseudogymnoascus sp. VKM F-4515 (FW-2607)]|nr:hypothetical protein V496_00904 [Pseudogymnoascus sp. VKM F-4515 (FW-2607)]